MSFEKILTLLDGLPGEQADFKSEMSGLVKALNQDKGKASADILKFKKELEDLKGQAAEVNKQNATYQDIAKTLSKMGVDAKNADELMKKLDIKKSVEDENAILKDHLTKANDKLKGFETQQQINSRKEKVTPMFEKALGEFVEAQRKDGKPNYNLTDTFVDKDALYKEVDIDNDTLRNDHFTKVLQDADQKQQTFMESTGMDYTKKVHKQGLPNGHYENEKGINTAANEALKSVRENQGSMDSVIQGLARLHAAEKQEN